MKKYPAICHVCGKKFDVEADFCSFGATRDVEGVIRGVHSCGNHDKMEIAKAFAERQMSRRAYGGQKGRKGQTL
jgi:hypothetical protein